MDKQRLIQRIVAQLEADLLVIQRQLEAAHEAATHSESKATSKYETFGLENAYLADGQSRRLIEIRQGLANYHALPLRAPDEAVGITLGALICLQADDDIRWMFLGPDAAGLKVPCDDLSVTVITPRSPLGQSLLGRRLDDQVNLPVGGKPRAFEIVEVL